VINRASCCEQCGAPQRPTARFCGQCGAPGITPPPAPQPPSAATCQKCGKEINSGAKFCGNCGAKLG
jgi:predicted amidophosphoribosyltransferase